MKNIQEDRFLITQTAKQVAVEPHVLRYWEEELHLPIRRNEMGHRYYTAQDIERFREIKRLKENGLQLKAIRTVLFDPKNDMLLPEKTVYRNSSFEETQEECSAVDNRRDTAREEKAYRLQMLLKNMISEAVKESNSSMLEEIRDSVVKELDYQFRILGEEEEKRALEQQKQQEEHFRKLDESIRIATKEKQKRKKHSLF